MFRSLCLILTLLIPTIALAPPEPANSRISPEVLKAFLLNPTPDFHGARDLFEAAKENPQLRDQLNKVIESSPALKAAAKQGLLFRSDTQKQLETQFPRRNGTYQLATDPVGTAWQSFQDFQKSQDLRNEKPIPPNVARRRALDETVHLYQLPTATEEADLRRRANSEHWKYYKDRINYWEGQIQITNQKLAAKQEREFENWKQHLSDRIRRTRLENARRALEYFVHRNGSFTFGVNETVDGKSKRVGNVRITAANLKDFGLEFIEPAQSARYPEGNIRSTWLDRLSPPIADYLGAIYQLPSAGMDRVARAGNAKYRNDEKETLNQVKPHPSDGHLILKIPENLHKRAGGHAEIDLGDVASLLTKDLNPRLLTYREAVDGRMVEPQLREMAMREKTLAKLDRKLNTEFPKDRDGFHRNLNRLRENQLSPHSEPVETIAGHVARDSIDPPGDLLTGLEWHGYRENPNHWEERDARAIKQKRTGFVFTEVYVSGPRGKGLLEKISGGLYHSYDAIPAYLRPLVLWGAIGAASIGGRQFYQHGGFDFGGGSGGSEARMGDVSPGSNISDKDIRKRLDKKLYEISGKPGVSLPQHYDLATFGNVRENPEEFKTAKSQPDPQSAVRVKGLYGSWSAITGDDRNEYFLIPIPTPEGYTLNDLQVTQSGKEIPPEEYQILRVLGSNVFFAKWKMKSGVSQQFVSAGFIRDSATPPTDRPEFKNLDLARLQKLNQHLRNAGFPVLADQLDSRVEEAKRLGKPISLQRIADDFSETGIYTFRPEKSATQITIEIPRDNPFINYAVFSRDGKLATQCNTANQFLADYLRQYFKNQPNVKVENVPTYVLAPGESILTSADYHLRTLVSTEGGQNGVVLDATAKKLDISDNDSPFHRLGRSGPSNPEIRSGHEPRLGEIPLEAWIRRRRRLPWEKIESVPPTDEKSHEKRLKTIAELREKIIASPFVKDHSNLRPEPDLPLSKAMRLSSLMKNYAEGQTSLEEVGPKLEEIFSSVIGKNIKSPRDLRSALLEIVERELKRIDSLREKGLADQRKDFAEVTNDPLNAQIKNLLDFVAATDWSPLPKAPATACVEDAAKI